MRYHIPIFEISASKTEIFSLKNREELPEINIALSINSVQITWWCCHKCQQTQSSAEKCDVIIAHAPITRPTLKHIVQPYNTKSTIYFL